MVKLGVVMHVAQKFMVLHVNQRNIMGTVTQLEQPEEVIHDPSTTIVERIEMTPELRKAFEDAGYDIEDAK